MTGTARCPPRTARGSAWSPRPASPRSSTWFRDPERAAGHHRRRLRHRPARADPVGHACSRPLDLVRVVVDVVEEQVDELAAPGDERRCARRCCATRARSRSPPPQVYAAGRRGPRRLGRPARGAGRRRRCCAARPTTSMRSRAAALGWGSRDHVAVVVGPTPPDADRTPSSTRPAPGAPRAPRRRRCSPASRATAGRDPRRRRPTRWPPPRRSPTSSAPARSSSARPCPHLFAAGRSRPGALAGLRAAPAWPARPAPGARRRPAARAGPGRRPAGPRAARRPDLPAARSTPGGTLLETAAAYLEQARSLEATARALFVHPNTVRYRLRRSPR